MGLFFRTKPFIWCTKAEIALPGNCSRTKISVPIEQIDISQTKWNTISINIKIGGEGLGDCLIIDGPEGEVAYFAHSCKYSLIFKQDCISYCLYSITSFSPFRNELFTLVTRTVLAVLMCVWH